MKIAVFGLGYVGVTSAACLAKMGHRVFGVDVNPLKVDMIRDGRSPIVEAKVDDLVREQVAVGRLSATLDAAEAVAAAEVSLVCVGTPSNINGSLSLRHVRSVAAQIGQALRQINSYHVVCIRSTVLPGTTENEVLPILLEQSGKALGDDFGLAMNPEFLREGTSVDDFFAPPKIVVGEHDARSGGAVAGIYQGLDAPLFRTPIKVAESIKYADNAFHALKVVFGNEIGRVCKAAGCDSHQVMDIFCADTKLNIAPTYLKPGFAFGGSCLPKDVRALTYFSHANDVSTPMLNSLLLSNQRHIEHVQQCLLDQGKKRIGIVGLSFKSGTDDLRESPMVTLVEFLIGKGYPIEIYDEYVSVARLIGANREYIEKEIPHISTLLKPDLEEVIKNAEVVVVAKKEGECAALLEQYGDGRVWIDLVRLAAVPPAAVENYWGVCW